MISILKPYDRGCNRTALCSPLMSGGGWYIPRQSRNPAWQKWISGLCTSRCFCVCVSNYWNAFQNSYMCCFFISVRLCRKIHTSLVILSVSPSVSINQRRAPSPRWSPDLAQITTTLNNSNPLAPKHSRDVLEQLQKKSLSVSHN